MNELTILSLPAVEAELAYRRRMIAVSTKRRTRRSARSARSAR